ncbi:DUF3841 domain-containing protein [Azotosporobacter soli]|uniref:DUF3841 domain-containing protein n=1 Tax=Azotosporobacter soli TaxID=3055040 RepID=UPI0031FEC892
MRRGDGKLQLWTIQSLAAWQELERDGVLWCRPVVAEIAFLAAYQWMRDEMIARIGPPPHEDAYPLWAWYHWHGDHQPKPDMRYSGQLPPGTPGMRIEFSIPAEQVVLSDFILWHHVLNGWYLGESLADDAAFELERQRRGLRYPMGHTKKDGDLEGRVRDSWQRIFALNWVDPDQYLSLPLQEKSVQATLWEVRREQVLKAELFYGKGKWDA